MIGGIFLFWFFDALFFTMFIKEEFGEGVDSIDDLIERDMALGKYFLYFVYNWALNSLGQFISVLMPYELAKVADMENSDVEEYRMLSKRIIIFFLL